MIGESEMDRVFKNAHPEYMRGYQEGFESAQHLLIKSFENLLKDLKNLEAYTECTGTVKIKMR